MGFIPTTVIARYTLALDINFFSFLNVFVHSFLLCKFIFVNLLIVNYTLKTVKIKSYVVNDVNVL